MIRKLLRAVRKVWRSSITGRFVSKAFAAKHKSTTQEESIDA